MNFLRDEHKSFVALIVEHDASVVIVQLCVDVESAIVFNICEPVISNQKAGVRVHLLMDFSTLNRTREREFVIHVLLVLCCLSQLHFHAKRLTFVSLHTSIRAVKWHRTTLFSPLAGNHFTWPADGMYKKNKKKHGTPMTFTLLQLVLHCPYNLHCHRSSRVGRSGFVEMGQDQLMRTL